MTVLYGANDWLVFFYATRLFLSGGNPYLYQSFGEFGKVYEPVWTYILLAPFSLLPFAVSRYVVAAVAFLVFALSAYKMGAKPWQLGLFLLSYPVIGGMQEGNIDWLVTAGLWMPPSIGLFFILMKPQIGFGVAIFWAIRSYREGGWRKLLKVFAPVSIAYLASFLVYGLWIQNLVGMNHNPATISVFPYGIVIGAFLLYQAIRRKEQNLSAISSPWFAPYATLYNFSGSLLSMFDRPRLFIVSWVLLWIPAIIHIITWP